MGTLLHPFPLTAALLVHQGLTDRLLSQRLLYLGLAHLALFVLQGDLWHRITRWIKKKRSYMLSLLAYIVLTLTVRTVSTHFEPLATNLQFKGAQSLASTVLCLQSWVILSSLDTCLTITPSLHDPLLGQDTVSATFGTTL